jgi:hypothetical protein
MKDLLRPMRAPAFGFGIVVVLLIASIFVGLFFIMGGLWLSTIVLPWLAPIMWLVVAFDCVILLPLSTSQKTKEIAAVGLYISSYVFGLTVWLLGFLLTYLIWGAAALILGLLFVGVGVDPMGMVACVFEKQWSLLGNLVFLTMLTYGTRIFSFALAERMHGIQHARPMRNGPDRERRVSDAPSKIGGSYQEEYPPTRDNIVNPTPPRVREARFPDCPKCGGPRNSEECEFCETLVT